MEQEDAYAEKEGLVKEKGKAFTLDKEGVWS